jgi:hypothetical protein
MHQFDHHRPHSCRNRSLRLLLWWRYSYPAVFRDNAYVVWSSARHVSFEAQDHVQQLHVQLVVFLDFFVSSPPVVRQSVCLLHISAAFPCVLFLFLLLRPWRDPPHVLQDKEAVRI